MALNAARERIEEAVAERQAALERPSAAADGRPFDTDAARRRGAERRDCT